ncbi:MAG: PilZ domain-containing protein [Myxococcales bacterium]|nr:MAG: PilZ domain-containing protein [Myxococcales bacterium]
MAARQFGAKREARRAVRRLVDLECDVYSELWGEAIAHRATDVSEDGLWIQTELLLELGTEVTLTFYPPDWEEPLCVAGRVQRVQLRARPGDGSAVGMGIAFETLRNDERRRLTRSMRCLRAQESYILDQRTLTGVPVGVGEPHASAPDTGRTIAGWAAPSLALDEPRPSRITANPGAHQPHAEPPKGAFTGGLDLAASVFSSDTSD